jgi:hypothetical protein
MTKFWHQDGIMRARACAWVAYGDITRAKDLARAWPSVASASGGKKKRASACVISAIIITASSIRRCLTNSRGRAHAPKHRAASATAIGSR